MNKALSFLAAIIGIVLVGVAVVYFLTPANSLPAFLPGYDPATAKTHLKHALAALVLGIGFAASAWLARGKKSPGQIAAG